MLADYHVHTKYSDDSDYPMEEVVQDAIRMGVDEICFTDHVDYGIKVDWDNLSSLPEGKDKPFTNVDYPRYVAEIDELKKRYQDKISLRTGLEFGVQTHTTGRYRKLFHRYPFDFILLSIHEIGDKELWNQEFQTGLSQKEYHERYYGELLKIVDMYKEYSVLAHLDLVHRYDLKGEYPFGKEKDVIAEILKMVIRDGKGIEVNTSGYRYGLGGVSPSLPILSLYRDLGGTILTLGSDSHQKGQLMDHMEETKRMLLNLGFDSFCTYDRMEPKRHPL